MIGETATRIYLEPRHLQMVQDILRAHVPGREVWVFGSRATGVRLKQFSDLDIVIGGDLSLAETGALIEAFDESLLPMKVDVVAMDGVSIEFAERVKADLVPLPY